MMNGTVEYGQSVVMLPLGEYNAWHLLSTPANVAHLQQSIAEDQAGYHAQHELLDANAIELHDQLRRGLRPRLA